MAVTSGFFNSVSHDRKYNAKQLSSLFSSLITDGIFVSQEDVFAVKTVSGMDITVGKGKAWYHETWTNNDALFPLTVAPSESVLDRIDAVVLEVDTRPTVRANTFKMVKGTPGTTPVPPTLLVSEEVNQHVLCHIFVDKGAEEILQSKITNLVGTEVTPFITGVLEGTAIDNLIAQWQGEWLEWMDTVHETLTDDVAGHLLSMILRAAYLQESEPADPTTASLWFKILRESTINIS